MWNVIRKNINIFIYQSTDGTINMAIADFSEIDICNKYSGESIGDIVLST